MIMMENGVLFEIIRLGWFLIWRPSEVSKRPIYIVSGTCLELSGEKWMYEIAPDGIAPDKNIRIKPDNKIMSVRDLQQTPYILPLYRSPFRSYSLKTAEKWLSKSGSRAPICGQLLLPGTVPFIYIPNIWLSHYCVCFRQSKNGNSCQFSAWADTLNTWAAIERLCLRWPGKFRKKG